MLQRDDIHVKWWFQRPPEQAHRHDTPPPNVIDPLLLVHEPEIVARPRGRPTIAMRNERLQTERAQREANNSTQREPSGFERIEEALNGPSTRGRGRGRGVARARGRGRGGEGGTSGDVIQSIAVDGVGLFQAFRM